MRNNNRRYWVCLLVCLLIFDAVAANIKVDTSRLRKRQSKGIALGGTMERQSRKHMAIINNKKFLVKLRNQGGYSQAGENGECAFSQPSEGATSLHETFDVIAQRCAPVDT